MTSMICVSKEEGVNHTVNPLMTGTSIVGVKYNGGVLLCCDTMISYGSLHYKKGQNRFEQLTRDMVLVGSGEVSDL